MSARKRKIFSRILTPQTEEEAAELLSQIRSAQENIEDLQRDLVDEITELKSKTALETAPHRAFINESCRALLAFADANRLNLTKNGKRKTIRLATGTLLWRTTPPAVHIANVRTVLTALHRLGLESFIRVSEAPDKEAMLKQPDIAQTIDGVKITRSEEFVVKPEGGKEIVTRIHKRRIND